jgi:hypothetical protein
VKIDDFVDELALFLNKRGIKTSCVFENTNDQRECVLASLEHGPGRAGRHLHAGWTVLHIKPPFIVCEKQGRGSTQTRIDLKEPESLEFLSNLIRGYDDRV